MSLERKESKQTESSIIQSFTSNPENVMNSYGQRSIGVTINRLSSRYFKNKTDEQIDAICNETVSELKDIAATMLDAGLKAGIEHILTVINSKPDNYDHVEIYLPVQGSKPLKYKYVDSYFPLKQVLTLSWLALNDDKQFAHHPVNPKEVALDAKKERRTLMFQSFKMLSIEKPCHLGHRQQLIFPLNKSAIDVDFIPDGKTPILKYLKENSYPLFWKKWNDATTTDATKKQLMAALIQWMKENNISTFIAMVDPAQTILTSLKEFFIQHGSDADSTEKEYNLAIQFANFEPDANFPVLSHLHGLLAAEEIRNQVTFNKTIETVKAWVEAQFDLENVMHQEWVHQIYALQEAQDLLHRYHLLLVLTGKRDAFHSLENFLKSYFDNFKIETLPNAPEEILIAVNALKEAVYQSKRSTLNDQIENFFAKWYEAHGIVKTSERNNRLSLHYSTLLSHDFQTKTRLTDETIQRFIKKSQAESVDAKLDIEPYQVNRFFLHAIMTDPKSDAWTDLFTFHLKVVLNFVKNYFNEGNVGLTAVLKRDSYPDTLIEQIDYLISVREGQPVARPQTMIVLPQNIGTVEEWLQLTQWIDEPTRETIYKNYGSMIRRVAMQAPRDAFVQISRSIPVTALIDFYKSTGLSTFPRFIDWNVDSMMSDLFKKVPHQQIDLFVNLLIDEYFRSKDLTLAWFSQLFRAFSNDIHVNTFERMRAAFIEKNVLFENVKLFPPAKKLALIKKIARADIIKILIAGNGTELTNCLSSFPDEERISILYDLSIQLLRGWNQQQHNLFNQLLMLLPVNERESLAIRFYTFNDNIAHWQLAETIALLPLEKINGFMTQLGEERIRKLFYYGENVGRLLYHLPTANWEHLFQMLGQKFLNEKLIYAAQISQLFVQLTSLPDKLEFLIARIGNIKLRQIAAEDESLNYLLMNLPDERVKRFLTVNIGSAVLKKIRFQDYAFYLKSNKPHLILARQIAEDPEYAGDLAKAKSMVDTVSTLLKADKMSKKEIGYFFQHLPQESKALYWPTKQGRPTTSHFTFSTSRNIESEIRQSVRYGNKDLDSLLDLLTMAEKINDGMTAIKLPVTESMKNLLEIKKTPETFIQAPMYFAPPRQLTHVRQSAEQETKIEAGVVVRENHFGKNFR